MATIRVERKGFDPDSVHAGLWRVEMWEQVATAGHFVFEGRTETVTINRNQQQVGLARKMFGGCFLHLRCG